MKFSGGIDGDPPSGKPFSSHWAGGEGGFGTLDVRKRISRFRFFFPQRLKGLFNVVFSFRPISYNYFGLLYRLIESAVVQPLDKLQNVPRFLASKAFEEQDTVMHVQPETR